jgi:hypothetical protein
MLSNDTHHLIDFASRFSDPSLNYLNAHMAIARLETLLEDQQKTRRLLETSEPKEHRWAPWIGAEIVSYYAVGYVTCLEWHAKSRLVDLLNFRPESIKIEDVKGTIKDALIVEMVAKQASVVQLVGAATKVASTQQYISTFERIFRELGVSCKLVDWLVGKAEHSTICWIKASQLADLDRLFQFRHTLVHEIGIDTMGHMNVRDGWSPEEAARFGGLVASLMRGIEAAITRFGPKLFPNMLTEDGYPVSPVTQLEDEVARIDAALDPKIVNFEWNNDGTGDLWRAARGKFVEYVAAEEEFVTRAGILHWRYHDARTPLRRLLYRYRLDFLTTLASSFDRIDDPDAGDATPTS